MQLLCILTAACVFAANAGTIEVTPIQKVVQLLEGMLEKGKKEKHAEQVQFAATKQFCDDTSVEKKEDIKDETEVIAKKGADIQKDTSDDGRLRKGIAGLDEDVSVWTGDIKAATKVRAIEKADYDATHKDYSESIDAIARAIAVLKKQSHDRKQKSSLTQVTTLKSLSLIPAKAKKALDLFLQEAADESAEMEGLAVSAPEANGYEFQSHGVIDMLEKLADKFTDERTTLEKEEANSKHAFDMLVQDLKAQIAQATKGRGEKAVTDAKVLQHRADATGDKEDTTALKVVDTKSLSSLTASCSQKASDFESRQQLRAEEITSIEKTIGIIKSKTVSGFMQKHWHLMQKKGSSLSQLRANSNSMRQEHVVEYLRTQAAKLNSRVLAAVAMHAGDDPFGKVKKMLKDLIVRLMEEANEEAEHKGWCDTELSTNSQTRKEKTEAVESLHAEIDQLQASISKLTDSIGDLTKSVSELDAAMATATKLRTEEKAKNAETISDSQDAQTAVAQALTVLKEFFAKAAEATAFMQDPYKGMAEANKGVVGMLEVIQSDFARVESDTSSAEASGQKEYDSFMEDSKVDKAKKETSVEHKSAKKQDETQALTAKKSDLEGTQKELDAALAYFDKLKPSCVDSGVSYEDRVARRKEEVESLQEALKILNGEDIA